MATERWRQKAAELLPELRRTLRQSDTPMAFWVALETVFRDAYDPPRNDDLLLRIYGYAGWCLDEGERDDDAAYDLPTAVVVCFYEHIPTIPGARAEMPRWFPREEVVAAREAFSYFLPPGGFEELLQEYDRAAAEMGLQP